MNIAIQRHIREEPIMQKAPRKDMWIQDFREGQMTFICKCYNSILHF